MKLLREPLVQFLLLGAALFLIFGAIGEWATTEQILISPAKVNELVEGFRLDFKRPATPDETDRLIAEYIREEVLCREAWARGIDRDNSAVRRALRLEMETLNGNSASAVPTDQQLQEFVGQHPEMFRKSDGSVPPLVELRTSAQMAWAANMQKQARDSEYQAILKKYHVIVQKPAPTSQPATRLSEGG